MQAVTISPFAVPVAMPVCSKAWTAETAITSLYPGRLSSSVAGVNVVYVSY